MSHLWGTCEGQALTALLLVVCAVEVEKRQDSGLGFGWSLAA